MSSSNTADRLRVMQHRSSTQLIHRTILVSYGRDGREGKKVLNSLQSLWPTFCFRERLSENTLPIAENLHFSSKSHSSYFQNDSSTSNLRNLLTLNPRLPCELCCLLYSGDGKTPAPVDLSSSPSRPGDDETPAPVRPISEGKYSGTIETFQ